MPHTHRFKEETMNAKQRIVAWLASLAMAILLAPSMAGAEELSYSALMSRIDALESQLHQQHADFVAYEMGGAQKDDGNGKGNGKGKGGGTPSVYAGYEATVLRPYLSSNLANYLGAPGWDADYGVGHRFTIGRDGGNGVGGRIRYWTFNHGHELNPVGATTLNLDMDVVDLEATLQESLCNIDLLLSGGVRYGRAAFSLGLAETYFEGTGPTVSLQASRQVGSRGLSLIGNLRGSLLIGEIRDAGGLIAAPLIGDTVDDEIATVLESQLGVGWVREMGMGELHVRALWETQFWLNDTFANDVVTPAGGAASNLALSGATLAVEFRR